MKIKNAKAAGFLIGCLMFGGFGGRAQAAGGTCEVIQVSGHAILQRQGQPDAPLEKDMKLQVGDMLVVGLGASADLAFDAAWDNAVRVSQDTRVTVLSLDPVKLQMTRGDIYARLSKLPKGSTFEVRTPTAVASVRGTKFRTIHRDGKTTVINDSETSEVYVYRLDANGNPTGDPVVLKPGESVDFTEDVKAFDNRLEPDPLDDLERDRDRQDENQLDKDIQTRRDNESRGSAPEEEGEGY